MKIQIQWHIKEKPRLLWNLDPIKTEAPSLRPLPRQLMALVTQKSWSPTSRLSQLDSPPQPVFVHWHDSCSQFSTNQTKLAKFLIEPGRVYEISPSPSRVDSSWCKNHRLLVTVYYHLGRRNQTNHKKIIFQTGNFYLNTQVALHKHKLTVGSSWEQCCYNTKERGGEVDCCCELTEL